VLLLEPSCSVHRVKEIINIQIGRRKFLINENGQYPPIEKILNYKSMKIAKIECIYLSMIIDDKLEGKNPK
jgi:hypothetical protein